jgi:hypothetical protein
VSWVIRNYGKSGDDLRAEIDLGEEHALLFREILGLADDETATESYLLPAENVVRISELLHLKLDLAAGDYYLDYDA